MSAPKRSLPNKSTLIGIGYILLLLLPSFLFSSKGMIRAAYPMLILLALFNSWRVFLWSTLLFFVAIPGALFFAINFKAPLNESFWIITLGSNLIEASDYLQTNAIAPFGIALLFLAYWIYAYRNLETEVFIRRKWRSLCLALLIIPAIHVTKSIANPLGEMNHHFTESYPWNLPFSYASAAKDISRMSAWNLEEDNHRAVSTLPQQTLVLVIGESARRDRHQLYGAAVPNNPQLSALNSELHIFTDVITLHPHTVASIPVMLTKQTGFDSVAPVASFIQTFKKAGYKTFWISNQSSLGGESNRIGAYARTADYSKFFHIHDASNPNALDEDVLTTFKEHTHDPAPKKLFVLHLQGSHYGFERRYPSEFAQFEDAYDNTLLYTDYILGSAIQELRNEKSPNALLYLSDHGLLLNQCGKKFTHFDNKESYEVPFFIWTSQQWNKAFPKALKNMQANQNHPLTTEIVADSLVDLAGIRANSYSENLSALSTHPRTQERFVKTYGPVVSYDQGENDRNCHLAAKK